MNAKWIRPKSGLYFYSSARANGEIFKSPDPLRRWAWAVYHERGMDKGIVSTLACAKFEADSVIMQAERGGSSSERKNAK
jgi:hypothetical protein